MPTNYVEGPDLHHFRKGLHLSRKQQPAPKKMPLQELWLQRPYQQSQS